MVLVGCAIYARLGWKSCDDVLWFHRRLLQTLNCLSPDHFLMLEKNAQPAPPTIINWKFASKYSMLDQQEGNGLIDLLNLLCTSSDITVYHIHETGKIFDIDQDLAPPAVRRNVAGEVLLQTFN